jgi:peroxiredoxin
VTDQLPDERPQRRREYSGASSTLGVAALVILVVGAAIWFFELRADDAPGLAADGTGVIALPDEMNPTGRSPSAQQGRAAPNFRLNDALGEPVALTDYRGKWVLVNFWATWCPPCRDETPDLQEFYLRNGGGRTIVVLGVNQQETVAQMASFGEEFGVTYPLILDRHGGVSQAYRVARNLPVTILIDPAGVIVEIYYGQVSMDTLERIEREYLGT